MHRAGSWAVVTAVSCLAFGTVGVLVGWFGHRLAGGAGVGVVDGADPTRAPRTLPRERSLLGYDPHAEALLRVLESQEQLILRLDTGASWMAKREWSVGYAHGPGVIDSTNWMVVTFETEGTRVRYTWFVDLYWKTIETEDEWDGWRAPGDGVPPMRWPEPPDVHEGDD